MPQTTKSLKTPLRYPGGKSRATVKLAQFFPDMNKYKEFREPFLGGGSVALYVTKMFPHLEIWVNDSYEPLHNFWCELQHNGQDLEDAILSLKNLHPDRTTARELFNQSKEDVNDKEKSNLARACAFYIVNKCSFSGLTESSSFSPQASESNFSFRGIERLSEYSKLIENWTITNLSYERMLSDEKDIFSYLDPPYDIKDNLYGKKGSMHKNFDHDKFAKDCDEHNIPMMVSYNSDQLVRDRFNGWNAAEFDLTYTMRSVGEYMRDQKQRKELILMNYSNESEAMVA